MKKEADVSEQELVLSALEPDQLAEAKKQRIPRRKLRRGELAVLWGLRVYVLFMLVVIIYQVWTTAR
jgi:hypothetical protein